MSSKDSPYVFVDGEFVLAKDAKISVFDHGLLYGDGVFDAIKAYSGRPFKLGPHLDRLWQSAAVLQLEIPMGRAEMEAAIFEILERNQLEFASIRVVITRGVGNMLLDPRGCKPSVIIMAFPLVNAFGKKAIRVKTSAIRRTPSQAVDSRIKSLNYLNNIMAYMDAINAGAEEALLLDINGFICEGSRENVFLVKQDRLLTPRKHNILEGITRDTVIELANQRGLQVIEADLTLGDAYRADEMFMTGTAAEITPIVELDGRSFGEQCPGPITSALLGDFQKLVLGAQSPAPV